MNTQYTDIKQIKVLLDGEYLNYEVRKTLGGGVHIFALFGDKTELIYKFNKEEVSVTDTMESLFYRWVERNPYEHKMASLTQTMSRMSCCDFDSMYKCLKQVQEMVGSTSKIPLKYIIECAEDLL